MTGAPRIALSNVRSLCAIWYMGAGTDGFLTDHRWRAGAGSTWRTNPRPSHRVTASVAHSSHSLRAALPDDAAATLMVSGPMLAAPIGPASLVGRRPDRSP